MKALVVLLFAAVVANVDASADFLNKGSGLSDDYDDDVGEGRVFTSAGQYYVTLNTTFLVLSTVLFAGLAFSAITLYKIFDKKKEEVSYDMGLDMLYGRRHSNFVQFISPITATVAAMATATPTARARRRGRRGRGIGRGREGRGAGMTVRRGKRRKGAITVRGKYTPACRSAAAPD